MKRSILAFSGLVLLAGCGTTVETIKTERVEIPVPVPCQAEDIREPIYPVPAAGANVYDKTLVLIMENELRKNDQQMLRVALDRCRKGIGPMQ